MTYCAELSSLYVAITLFAAVIGKLTAFAEFKTAITVLFPAFARRARIAGVAVIGAESLASGLLLAGPPWARSGTWVALFLILGFTLLLSRAITRGHVISCNCFGNRRQPLSRSDLLRNLFLIFACCLYLLKSSYPNSDEQVTVYFHAVLFGLAVILVIITVNLDAIDWLVVERL